jgi:hypothetical protein
MPDGQLFASLKKLMLTGGLNAVAAVSRWLMARFIADPFISLGDRKCNFADAV